MTSIWNCPARYSSQMRRRLARAASDFGVWPAMYRRNTQSPGGGDLPMPEEAVSLMLRSHASGIRPAAAAALGGHHGLVLLGLALIRILLPQFCFENAQFLAHAHNRIAVRMAGE